VEPERPQQSIVGEHPHAQPPAGPHHHHPGHVHSHGADTRALRNALILLLAFMVLEIVSGIVASSLALLSDAAHMLTDAVALGLSLLAARLAARPATGALTFGLGRAEILSAQANGLTMLVLGALIAYGAVVHLISPSPVQGGVVLAVALAGIAVNLVIVRILHGGGEAGRALNVEGSYRHILTDLYAFIATAIAAGIIIATGFSRADAIAALLIAGLMLRASLTLLRSSLRVMMEASPAGLDPQVIGRTLAEQPGVTEVHDLHVWEVTTGFAAISAHVMVASGLDCHQVRRSLARLLSERFGLAHSTLQVEHARAPQPPMQIEVTGSPHVRRGEP
jgi:cobalt-zinc-cadmium efflux system protein